MSPAAAANITTTSTHFFTIDDELILERNDFKGKLPAKGIEIVS
jgi:hypothetical protein